jgi:hypothetical protein
MSMSANWQRASESIGLLFAILALVVGVYHLIEIRRASKALSTRYVGEFPHFLPEIVNLISSARRHITIFCDFPGYGDFSAPAAALDYRHVIERQIQKGLTVELLCLDSTARARYAEEQFPVSEWSNWKENPDRRARVKAFLRAHTVVDDDKICLADLLKLMEAVDRHTLQTVFLRRARELPIDMPIYFWVADGRRAVLSFPALAEKAVERGFLTSDHALVQALLEIRERYTRRGSPSAGEGEAAQSAHQEHVRPVVEPTLENAMR